jgi:hypothetical protein
MVEESTGARGEFSVLVDGRVVARKEQSLPSVEDVVQAVRKAAPQEAGQVS